MPEFHLISSFSVIMKFYKLLKQHRYRTGSPLEIFITGFCFKKKQLITVLKSSANLNSTVLLSFTFNVNHF